MFSCDLILNKLFNLYCFNWDAPLLVLPTTFLKVRSLQVQWWHLAVNHENTLLEHNNWSKLLKFHKETTTLVNTITCLLSDIVHYKWKIKLKIQMEYIAKAKCVVDSSFSTDLFPQWCQICPFIKPPQDFYMISTEYPAVSLWQFTKHTKVITSAGSVYIYI